MMEFDVNNKQVRDFTRKLQQMHRSNFPIAVRQTLNDLAFDVKQNTLLESAGKEFTLRNPTFFKSHSSVKKAVGWDVNSMKSEVGIIAKGSTVAMDLRKQEYGGVSKKSMVYVDPARVGNNKTKLVRLNNYINKKGVVKGAPSVDRNDEPQFVANAYVAKKTGKLLFGRSRSGTAIYKVDRITFGKTIRKKVKYNGKEFSTEGRSVKVTMTPLADYEQNRTITLKARPFLKPASLMSYNKANTFFIKNAQKRLDIGRK